MKFVFERTKPKRHIDRFSKANEKIETIIKSNQMKEVPTRVTQNVLLSVLFSFSKIEYEIVLNYTLIKRFKNPFFTAIFFNLTPPSKSDKNPINNLIRLFQ